MSAFALPRLTFKALTINASAMVAARLLVSVLNIALVVSIARLAGVAPLGTYTLLLQLYLLGENVKSLGLPYLLVREVARDRASAAARYRSLVRIGYWGSLATAPIMYAVVLATNPASSEILVATGFMCLGLLPSSQVMANESLFLGFEKASYILWITLIEGVLRWAISLCALIWWGGSVAELAAIYAGTRFLAAAAGAIARRRLNLPACDYDPALTRAMLRRAPEFITVFVFPLLLFRMDVILLGLFSSDYELGIYSASMRLITAALIVPEGIMTATFAPLSRLAAGALPELQTFVRRMLMSLTSLLSISAIAAWLLAPFFLHTLYGDKFEASIPVMQILVWAWVPYSANRVLGDSMVALGKQATVAKIILASTALSIGLYIVLIRSYGAEGAALAFVLSIGILFALSAIVATSRFRVVSASSVAAAIAPAAAGFLGFEWGSRLTGALAFLAAQSIGVAWFFRAERMSNGADSGTRAGQEKLS
jgi:O-antigen/teichoic acid export membrane protein